MTTPALTSSQVKAAGRVLRKTMAGTMEWDAKRFQDAYETLVRYRAMHSPPLVAANNGVRSMLRTEGCQVQVSQRLKRMHTILDKLRRESTLPLSSMQDIGGVRAVLGSIEEIRRVEARLKKNRPVVGYSDYIANPRSSGYRGVHVVVMYGACKIEVQLRTEVMHQWAFTVEKISGRIGDNLKGDGNHAVQDLLAAISQAMATEEEGGTVTNELLDAIDRLRTAAAPYLGLGA